LGYFLREIFILRKIRYVQSYPSWCALLFQPIPDPILSQFPTDRHSLLGSD
jgi:hypothetical protein